MLSARWWKEGDMLSRLVQTTVAGTDSGRAISAIFVQAPIFQAHGALPNLAHSLRFETIIEMPAVATTGQDSFSYIDDHWLANALFRADSQNPDLELLRAVLRDDVIVIEHSPPLMGGEDLGGIPACLGRRPGAGESTLNPTPTQGRSRGDSAPINPQPKDMSDQTMIINGSGQDPPYRGKFEHAPWGL
jgi:hypothetical protein